MSATEAKRTSNWEELLKLAGSRNVRYVGETDGYHTYQAINNSAAPLVVYVK